MKLSEMTCRTCFYTKDTFLEGEKEGEGAVICFYTPENPIISLVKWIDIKPDIWEDPEDHSCGCGRWRDGDRWVGWIDAEVE